MNVSLAAQVLSDTVAIALRDFGSKEMLGTATFCKMMDRAFDMLNVRNSQHCLKKKKDDLLPYKDINDKRFQWLENEFLNYFENWKDSIEERGTNPQNIKDKMFISKATHEGLQITVRSSICLVRFLLKNGADYVLTGKFNQDVLENLFGFYRSAGRRKNNPSMADIGYSDNMVRNLKSCQTGPAGNCMPDEIQRSINNTVIRARKKQAAHA